MEYIRVNFYHSSLESLRILVINLAPFYGGILINVLVYFIDPVYLHVTVWIVPIGIIFWLSTRIFTNGKMIVSQDGITVFVRKRSFEFSWERIYFLKFIQKVDEILPPIVMYLEDEDGRINEFIIDKYFFNLSKPSYRRLIRMIEKNSPKEFCLDIMPMDM